MQDDRRSLKGSAPEKVQAPELPVRLVPYHGLVPEPLAAFFERQTPWTWRDLRTVFCRHEQTRRLLNTLRTIDLILEKAPHTLARGHWSIAGYKDALKKLEEAIARLGQLAGGVAGDARVRKPVVRGGPVSSQAQAAPRKPYRPAVGATAAFPSSFGGMKSNTRRPEAA